MGPIRQLATILAALLALLALPALAQASGTDVIRDCTYDGHIDGTYTQAEYDQAEQQLSSDNDQYTSCREVIQQARASAHEHSGSHGSGSGSSGGAGSGGSGGGSNSGGGSAAGGSSGTDGSSGSGSGSSDRRAGSPTAGTGDPALATASGAYAPTQEDKAAYERAVQLASSSPAAAAADPANSIPRPVLIALVAVGLLVLATTALIAGRRLPAARRVALRIFRR